LLGSGYTCREFYSETFKVNMLNISTPFTPL
jgi:hypothetical protein